MFVPSPQIPFFAKQPKAFLRSVVDHVQNDFLSPKHTILALFEPVELIIVAKGDMSVLDQSKICFRVVTQDEWFGEEVLFEDSRSKFELEAKTFCEILRLSRQHFQACMEKHFPRLKIAALMAQQKRRLAMIPSTDIRLQDVSSSFGTQVRGRTSGRSTLFVILQQVLRGASEDDSGLVWYYPESRFRKKWRRWKALLLLFVALEVPFTVAFEWRTGFFDKSASMQQWFLDVLVIVIEVFFYVDWAFRACVFARAGASGVATKEDSSTHRSTREELVMTPTAAAKAKDGVVTMPRDLWQLYLVRGSLAFDMAVNLPIAMTWNLVNSPRYSIFVREVMRCTRLLTFGRLVVLKRTLKKILVERDFSPASQLLANIVVFCVIAANGMACYFYLLADDKDFYEALPVGFDPDQTPVDFNECLEMAALHSNCTWFLYDRSKFSIKARYIRALHWSLVLLSTVGYGDILSFSNSECLLGFWWIFLGALICYFTSCAVSSVVSQLTVLRAAQDARVEAITRALVRTNVSSAMRIMIRSHYEANWEMNGSAFPEQKMMAHLPRSLRHQLSASLYVQSIRRCYVFSCLGGQAAMLREIALLMSSEMFLPRVTIVENGHLASALYIILSGDVELLLPYDASHRTSSTMRRRSVLDTHSQLPISVYGFYLRVVYYCFRHNQRRSSSASSAHPQAPPKHQQALGIPISALREGDCFGEEGLLDQRSALRVSARTLTGTQLAVLTRDSFMSLAGRFPVQVRQIVTLIAKKQDADMALFDTIRGNFLSRHKSLEFLGMSPSLYCVETPHVSNIISSEESRYKVWHIVHALVVIYNFYMITFRLAFLTRPSTTTRLMLTVLDYFTDAFLYADIYLKWNRFGYEEYGDQIVDLVAIRRRYKKGWLRVDCWSMLPLYYYGDFFSMSLARLPRLLKSLQLIENIDTLESLMREKLMRGSSAILSVFDLSKFLVFFLSAAHQIGSVYFLLGRLLTEYELVASSWITVDAVLNVYPGDVMVQYNRAIYWCLETVGFLLSLFPDRFLRECSDLFV
jgi:CRP-like cAMP-binding protein